MTTKQTPFSGRKFRRLLNDFEFSVREKAFMGSKPVEEHDDIKAFYRKSKRALLEAVYQMVEKTLQVRP